MDVRGKTAIVTGSAVGVGRATAIDLARRGANVVINYSRSEDDAREAVRLVEAEGAKALLVRADVSDDAQARSLVSQAVDAFGALHVLVNNAATTHFVGFPDLEGMKAEYWDDILNVNVKGAFFCARAAAPAMKAAGQGAIVNVASVAGVYAVGSSIAYAASKAALINMTIALARVLGPEVRVNAVAPGFIETRWLLQRARREDVRDGAGAPGVARAAEGRVQAGGRVAADPQPDRGRGSRHRSDGRDRWRRGNRRVTRRSVPLGTVLLPNTGLVPLVAATTAGREPECGSGLRSR